MRVAAGGPDAPGLGLLSLKQEVLMFSMGTIGRLPGNGASLYLGSLEAWSQGAKDPLGSLSADCTALI